MIARGLGAAMLVVADGAPGLIKAIEQSWPASDRQHCAVHRVRNPLAKLPDRERERVRQAYWHALDDATNQRDGKQRLQALVDELQAAGYTAACCLADDLDALVVHLRYPTRHRRRWRSTNLLERCYDDLFDPAARFDHTVDHLLTKPRLTTRRAVLTGNDPGERTASGLWPSDYGGVVSRLCLRR